MKTTLDESVAAMIHTGRAIMASGLVAGTGGNMSVRVGDAILVTVTGSNLGDLSRKTLVLVDIESGQPLNCKAPRPTCEVMVHLACYAQNPGLRAVVHCHPIWTIGVVSGHGSVPPMFPELVDDVGAVGYVDFVLPSTAQMAAKVGRCMQSHHVCVIRNHGIFSGGRNLTQALNRAIILEDSAKAFAVARLAGAPQYLTAKQVRQVERLEATTYRRRLSDAD